MPTYATGGPGNKGNRLPIIPMMHKIIPSMIQIHSKFVVFSLLFEVRDLRFLPARDLLAE